MVPEGSREVGIVETGEGEKTVQISNYKINESQGYNVQHKENSQ